VSAEGKRMTIDIEKCKRCKYWNGTSCNITMCVKERGEKMKERKVFKMGIKVKTLLEYVGKLEDIEEKLGIGLMELFELAGKYAYSIEDDYIIEYEIKAIEIEKDAWFIRTDVSNFGITKRLWLPDFNKTWFLTEEAAEKKLKELNKNEQ